MTNLREIRLHRGLTYRDLAEALGVAHTTIRQAEYGLGSRRMKERIAAELALPFDEVFPPPATEPAIR